MNEHDEVVRSDSEKGTRSSSDVDGVNPKSTSESSWEKLSSGSVSDTIAQLELESQNPKDGLLQTLKRYEPNPSMRVGGIKSRVAPTVL